MKLGFTLAILLATLATGCASSLRTESTSCGQARMLSAEFSGLTVLDVWGAKQAFAKILIDNPSKATTKLFTSTEVGPVLHGYSYELQKLKDSEWKPAVLVLEELSRPTTSIKLKPNTLTAIYVNVDGIATDPNRDQTAIYRVDFATSDGCRFVSDEFGI